MNHVLTATKIFVLFLLPSITFAAKHSEVTGNLEMLDPLTSLATVNSAELAYHRYGDQVTFGVSVEGSLARKGWIYVTLVCWQESEVVYQASNWNDYTFTLSDLAGQGLEWDGYPAECTADLIYRVEKGKQAILEYLDSVGFAVN